MSIPYGHPEAKKIEMQAKDILSKSALGDQLLNSFQGRIEVIHGPVSQSFCPTENLIILRVPSLKTSADIEQAIDLAYGLIEHKDVASSGFPPPHDIQEEEAVFFLHSRNLEVILRVFPIAQQLDEEGFKAIAELRHSGLSKLYQTWKAGGNLEECANVYWGE